MLSEQSKRRLSHLLSTAITFISKVQSEIIRLTLMTRIDTQADEILHWSSNTKDILSCDDDRFLTLSYLAVYFDDVLIGNLSKCFSNNLLWTQKKREYVSQKR